MFSYCNHMEQKGHAFHEVAAFSSYSVETCMAPKVLINLPCIVITYQHEDFSELWLQRVTPHTLIRTP